MKKLKKRLAKCSCCSTEKHRTEMKINLSMFDQMQRGLFKHYKELELKKYNYASFVESDFEWACDNCLATKKATLASPGRQQSSGWPHLAYSDRKLNCSSCKIDFLFTKEEKKTWYEAYQLPTYAKPSNCLTCRRKIRQQKLENKTVSEILNKSEDELTEDELKTVIDIYISWDKVERVKYFQSVLNKRLKKK